MEVITSLLILRTPNCCMGKVGIKDTYSYAPFLPERQKYLKFYFRGKLYQFTCLPNYLCSGPRKSTKLPPFPGLRLQLVAVTGLVDDLITLGRRFVKCERNIRLIVAVRNSLGFVVPLDKSIFFPIRSTEYLSFVTDSESINVSLITIKSL